MSEPALQPQRRRRSLVMSPQELDAYLTTERTCRMATTGPDGAPHQSPLYFVWDAGRFWVSSLVRSQRWLDIERDARVSVIVDSGGSYGELCGVEIRGVASRVGEAPRTGEPNAELEHVEALMAAKYDEGLSAHDGRHAWLAIEPRKIVSWDFRKLVASSG